MAITQAYTGTETVTTTEWSLTTDAAGPAATVDTGCYEVMLDLSALATGDIYELKIHEKVVSGGTQRHVKTFTFSHAQTDPHPLIYIGMMIHGWDVTLDKVSGTDRSITWSIREAA